MLKLQEISKQMKEDTINSQCTLRNLCAEKIDVEVQTDQIEQTEQTEQTIQSDLLPPEKIPEQLSEKIQPPSLLASTQNPRRKTSLPSSRRIPPILLKTRTPISKKRTNLTRPIHV